jgi:hypothetical protein
VALVGETGRQGDLGQWQGGGGELAARVLHPQPAEVLAHGAAVVLAEGARQVGRVDADGKAEVAQGQVLGEPVLEQRA